jgi:tetratricopeptide (TPR) repeat protein
VAVGLGGVIAIGRAGGVELAAAVDHKLGGVYHRLEEWDLAASYYQTALALCEKHPEGEDIRARIKTDWCLTAYRGGEMELATRLAGEALELAESSQDTLALAGQFGDRHREAALHSNYADLLHATDRAESALEHLKQSAALLTQIGGEESIRRPEIWKLVEW